jgi:hypothetical protein
MCTYLCKKRAKREKEKEKRFLGLSGPGVNLAQQKAHARVPARAVGLARPATGHDARGDTMGVGPHASEGRGTTSG